MSDLNDALDRLQARLERLDAPMIRHLRAGVPPDEAVARVRDATGRQLPDQAARWFPPARDFSSRPLMVECGGDHDGQVDLIH